MDPSTLAQGWFEVRRPEAGVVTIVEPLHVEAVKAYLVIGEQRAALIDTGMGVGDIRALVRELTDLPLLIVNSHAHWDHVGGTASFAEDAGIEILVHAAEADDLARGVSNERMRRFMAPAELLGPLPPGFDPETAEIRPARATRLLHGGETLDLGGRSLDVIHTPGHSPGGIALHDRANGILFSTDAAYPGALYAQMADSNLDDYRRTMRTLANLASDLRVCYPSHDASPMDPALLPAMADALDGVAAGRSPNETTAGVARHQFAGFSVLVPGTGVAPA